MDSDLQEGLNRFFFPKTEVHNYWYAPVDNFEFVTGEFYELIEKELKARRVPGLTISRVELGEGGVLSAKREYLRLKRERLVFDICAAPFGTSYFFSFRFVELPLGIKPLELLIAFIVCILAFGLLVNAAGLLIGVLLFLALLVGNIWFLRNAVALGLKDIDATLLKIPVVAPLYELLGRKETYFREDTRLMYVTTVNSITTALVEQVTTAKGIKLIKRFDRRVKGNVFDEKTSSKESGSETPA